MPAAVRALLLLPAAGSGALAGVLGSFVHPVDVVGLPAGLALAVLLTAGALVTWGLLVGRAGAVAAAAGWVVVVLLLAARRPEGDLVVPGSLSGYLWLLGGLVLAAACTALPYAAPTPPSGDEGTGR